MNKEKQLLVEISTGELLDKITILELKIQNFSNQAQLENVSRELEHLRKVFFENICLTQELLNLMQELRYINKMLWELEDNIRELERKNQFDKEFIETARQIYLTNNNRIEIKKKICIITCSKFFEEKNYSNGNVSNQLGNRVCLDKK